MTNRGPHVLLFCPDCHIRYNGRTPEEEGVGGGVTARIRLAAALAANGAHVRLQGSCPDSVVDGVHYLPLSESVTDDLDVLVAHSSGGKYDLTSAVSIEARRRVLLVSGTSAPKGVELRAWDEIVAPSRFIADLIRQEWNVRGEVIVVPHGVLRRRVWLPVWRHLTHLVYASHPSKGLADAISTVRRLGSGFKLHVYGGNALWGQKDKAVPCEPGVIYHGLVGQRKVWEGFRRAGLSLHLQTREEPFGLALIESMAAGCVPVASPVGAYPELIEDRRTGFLVNGVSEAVERIREFVMNPALAAHMRRAARNAPLDWSAVARRLLERWS